MHTIDTSLYTGCIEEIHGFLSDPRRRGNILLWLRVGILFIFVYIYFWLHRVFVAVCGLSLVVICGATLQL